MNGWDDYATNLPMTISGHHDLKQVYRDGSFWTLCACGKEFSGVDADEADNNQQAHREIREAVGA